MSDLNQVQNPHILSSPNQRRPQRRRVVGKFGGKTLHPINPVLAYRRFTCRLSLPAKCSAPRAGTPREYGVHDGIRGNSGSVRQGLTCRPKRDLRAEVTRVVWHEVAHWLGCKSKLVRHSNGYSTRCIANGRITDGSEQLSLCLSRRDRSSAPREPCRVRQTKANTPVASSWVWGSTSNDPKRTVPRDGGTPPMRAKPPGSWQEFLAP